MKKLQNFSENSQESVEELANLLELIHTALSEFDVSFKELEATREHKKKIRGGFEKRIFLLDVEDPSGQL